MADINITPLVETWRIANLTNFTKVRLVDVPGLNQHGDLPVLDGDGNPEWIDALDFNTADIIAASDSLRNALTTSPPTIASEGYKHTHQGLYDADAAGDPVPDASTWHSHSGLEILTGGVVSNADSLHTHDSLATTLEVSSAISQAIDSLDLAVYVTKDGSITQLSDITSDGAIIESAVAQAHAQDHSLLDHIDDVDPFTITNFRKLLDGSNADCCHTHSGIGTGTFDGEHNDLDGLNEGDYIHLTAAEYASLGTATGDHNELNGLQGGLALEYYHLDYDQYLALVGGSSVNADDYHTHDSAGAITVQDEGVEICAVVTTINFQGATVQAKDCIAGLVNVYIPPPSYVSHFDTSDGTNDCTVADASTTSRRVAGPTSEGTPYNIGGWTEGSTNDTVRTTESSFSYTTTNACSFLENTTTTIEVNVYDADGVATLATHTTAAIIGNTDVTVDNIRVQVTSWATNADQYQGIVTVTFDIDTILGDISGRFGVEIIHHNAGDGDFTYTQTPLFYDNESNAQTIGNVTIAENTPVIMRKSGVYYYDEGSTFTVAIDDLDYLNSESFPTTLVVITGTEYGLTTLNLASGALTGWTTKYDVIDVTYSNSAWTITGADYFIMTTTANVTGQVQDWTAGASDSSPDAAIIIDTYNDNSSRVLEDFQGETERLEDDLATSWDSTASLASADDGQGLQLGEGTVLRYPDVNYGTYEPSSGSQPDYSSLSGDRYYYRGMWHTGTSHSNGSFTLAGVTEQNLTDDDIIIEISLDGTDWYNCNELYTGGALSNGDGCRVSGNTMPTLDFTFGTGKNTSVSTGPGWGVWLKITMPSTSTVEMGSIQINNWT